MTYKILANYTRYFTPRLFPETAQKQTDMFSSFNRSEIG